MPWNTDYFPTSMRHLSEPARFKAIEIANALLSEGMDEGKVIRIAIAKAKEWAQHHGLPVRDDE
ncbi:hypothetical protein [Rhodoferax sp.]|uniref:hypothetical protein n=1 Tax=Rhodoferax sp. TaxID=50421 RepID=UPI002717B246|nr:hypothetical protein [Rhodoferax sp.]MDO9197627.1 hypothetical protein [Rhodoferax sp.]